MMSSKRGCCWGRTGTLGQGRCAPPASGPGPEAGCHGFGVAFNLLDQSTHTSLPEGPPVAVRPEDSLGSPQPSATFLHGHAARPASSRVTGSHSHACALVLVVGVGTSHAPGPDACVAGQWLSALSPAHCPPHETHSPSPALCTAALPPASSAPLCYISSSGLEEGGGRKLSVKLLLTRPAWPAARLSQTPGATGPAKEVLSASGFLFCGCGLST